MMMHKKLLLLSLSLVLCSVSAQAADVLIGIESGPGYVMPQDEYGKTCSIDTDGNLLYQYFGPKAEAPTKQVKKVVSDGRMKVMKRLIEDLRADDSLKVNEYQTGYGDLPGFDFVAFPQTTKLFLVHGDGKSVMKHSFKARRLVFLAATACGMEMEILKMLTHEMPKEAQR